MDAGRELLSAGDSQIGGVARSMLGGAVVMRAYYRSWCLMLSAAWRSDGVWR